MSRKKRFAVIGAGPSGLSAIKACKEENLDITCFEKSDSVGGAWVYREESVEGMPSMMRSTVSNTSKEMSAFSDFPFPNHFPNYMRHHYILKYFQLYAQKFELISHIKFHHEVVKAVQNDDYDITGRWLVTIRDIKGDRETEEVYDGIMVCTGQTSYPNYADYDGLNTFKGKVMHSHYYKTPNEFEGKNVLIIGFGNSGVDIAVELSSVAKKFSVRRLFLSLYIAETYNRMPSKKVAVIGAGSSGLTAIKSCKEEELDVVCLERSSHFGGLWRYHDDDTDGLASVMNTTIINTSKEMSAFSDFPPPKDFANFMHNSMMFKYFQLYAEKFDLLRHIRYHQEVVSVVPADDYGNTGRWVVTTKNVKDNTTTAEEFDGVMICVGHHVFPNVPSFPGQENFKGNIIHTHSLKSAKGYENMKVVIVGIGNSAVDAAVDISYVGQKVYLSTRRGSWINNRVAGSGMPWDILYQNRFFGIYKRLSTFESRANAAEEYLNKKFDHAAYNLKPKHRAISAHPTINDSLPNCILSGRIVVKGNVKRFEENGVVFEGEEEVTQVDAVVLATGYNIRFPFLSESILQVKDNQVQLYKYMFPPQLEHSSLAFIGLIQPLGAIFPISEAQSRWFVLLLQNKLKLPSKDIMLKDIKAKQESNSKIYVASPRHTIQVSWIPYMDEVTSQFGAKPNLLRLALTDPKLFWACVRGPCAPYQYRLNGPHPWPGARDAILSINERVLAPLSTRHVDQKEESVSQIKALVKYRKMILILSVLAVGVSFTKFCANSSNDAYLNSWKNLLEI